MADEFHEAVLSWGPQGPHPPVTSWLEQQGFSVTPMQTGLLLTGNSTTFNKAFGGDVRTMPRPARLPVPAPIAPHVQWIELPRPRTTMR
ncbi:MAG TPA: hypothetical protein VGZ22_21355 [Isosphaeraceae bacterium]|jgi:hypothetical protein|nr:hypothetical protein [Isosphaeraceae bacterium]